MPRRGQAGQPAHRQRPEQRPEALSLLVPVGGRSPRAVSTRRRGHVARVCHYVWAATASTASSTTCRSMERYEERYKGIAESRAAESDKISKREKQNLSDQRRKCDFLCRYRCSSQSPVTHSAENRILSMEGTEAALVVGWHRKILRGHIRDFEVSDGRHENCNSGPNRGLIGLITCNTTIRSTPNSTVLYTNANAYQSYKAPQRGLIA